VLKQMNRHLVPARASFARAFRLVLLFTLSTLLTGCQSLSFYSQAIHGQTELLTKRQAIPKLIESTDTPAPLKEKFQRVLEIREFAQKELLLPVNGHYLNYVDLDRRHVVWNVYAAREFSLEPRAWWYPIVGRLTYRGYFSEPAAQKYAAAVGSDGWQVYIGGVDAYSTLGWFKDPVLSTFIERSDAELADTLFHELAHQKMFFSGDTDFNEAFATAVADEGVRRWMHSRNNDEAYQKFLTGRKRSALFIALVLAARQQLEALYAKPPTELAALRAGREQIITQLRADYATLKSEWGGYTGYDAWMARPLNNAQLNTVSTYHHLVPAFRRLLERNENDLERFYRAVATMKRMTKDERRVALNNPG
jgi:predicted aminopeptidase